MMFKKLVLIAVFAMSSLFGMSLEKLNSATKSELMEINGIGEKKANAIIVERKKGTFKSFEDFQRVKGIGAEAAKNVSKDIKSTKKTKKVKKSKKIKKDKKVKKDKKIKTQKKKENKNKKD